MNSTIHIFGHNHEAINAALLVAELGKTAIIYASTDDINQTLHHYNSDWQTLALFDACCAKQKIIFAQHTKICADNHSNDYTNTYTNFHISADDGVWLFLDAQHTCQNFSNIALAPQSPMCQYIIISGSADIGAVDILAQAFRQDLVYYLPFIFAKEGASVNTFAYLDLVLVGEKTSNSVHHCDILHTLLHRAKKQSITDIKTAEFARAAIMGMLATRISFINEMARLADGENINIRTIERILSKDSRIGASYLSSGWGFGGRALPNELQILQKTCVQHKKSGALLEAICAQNNDQKELIFRKFWQYFNSDIEQKTVLIWGAGYRSNTFSTLKSAIHPLLSLLWSYNIQTIVYAKNTCFELQNLYQNPLLCFSDTPYPNDAIDAVFIINWSDNYAPNLNHLPKNTPIFDAKNIIDDDAAKRYDGDYIGIGRTF